MPTAKGCTQIDVGFATTVPSGFVLPNARSQRFEAGSKAHVRSGEDRCVQHYIALPLVVRTRIEIA